MLRFFRVNDPYRLLGVLVVMFLASLPLLVNPAAITTQELKDVVLGEALNNGGSLYTQVIDDTPWLAAKSAQWTESIFGRSLTARHILALIVLFFQAAFFSIMLVRNKAYNENNYFPALIFGVLCFFSFDMLSLSNDLWASTFLLFALSNLFKEIEFKVQRDETILNLGFYLGIASLLVFSYSIFLLGSLGILLAFARLNLRKSVMLIFGFGFPHALVIALYYFKGGLPQLLSLFYGINFTITTSSLISWTSLIWLGCIAIGYFVLSMVMLSREARFTRYQSQLLQVMLIWLLLALVNVIIARERTPHSFIAFIPSLSYFISHFLLLVRRKWIAELMLIAFMMSIILFTVLSGWEKLNKVDYSKMFVAKSPLSASIKNKKVLVLSDGYDDLLITNKSSVYFPNCKLSKDVFELGNYYNDLVLINDAFKNDTPDIIVDEKNLMKKIFQRLPLIEKHYQRNGVLYERKTKIR